MTSVSDVRPAPSHQQEPRGSDKPTPHDVRAMGEAFANARRNMPAQQKLAPFGTKADGKAEPKSAAGKSAQAGGRDTAARADGRPDDLADQLQRREEGDGGGRGSQGFPQTPLSAPQAAAVMPSPTADPSAFAQALADLWTRENGKGAREVSVRFGRSAWPATGARLVRNAAGTLDIALQLDPAGGAYGAGLPGLEQELTAAGVGVGALVIEPA